MNEKYIFLSFLLKFLYFFSVEKNTKSMLKVKCVESKVMSFLPIRECVGSFF